MFTNDNCDRVVWPIGHNDLFYKIFICMVCYGPRVLDRLQYLYLTSPELFVSFEYKHIYLLFTISTYILYDSLYHQSHGFVYLNLNL